MDNSLILKQANSIGVSEEQLKAILRISAGLIDDNFKTMLVKPFSFEKEQYANENGHATYKMIADFLQYRCFKNKGTETSYRSRLEQFFDYLKENNINRPLKQNIDDYIKTWGVNPKTKTADAFYKGFSDKTQQNYLLVIKIFFKYLAKIGIYPNIAEDVENIEVAKHIDRHHAISESQLVRLKASIGNKTLKQKRNLAIVTMMSYCCLRAVEISRATRGDFQQGMFIAHGKGKQTGGKPDYKTVVDEVDQIVRDYLVARALYEGRTLDDNEPLFVGVGEYSTGQPLTPNSICRLVKNELKKIGLTDKGISSHSLRKTFITTNYNEGTDLYAIQRGASHESFETTQIYIDNEKAKKNPSFENFAKAIRKVEEQYHSA